MSKMLVIQLLSLAALVATCPPLFNNIKLVGNSTHSTSHILRVMVLENSDESGWTESVSRSLPARTTWPDSHVKYCFTNQYARDNFEQDVKAAWDLWSRKIGPPSKAYGHSLRFSEVEFPPNAHPYCYSENTDFDWNPDVPGGTLSIGADTSNDLAGHSTVGYTPENFDRDPDRNEMRLDINAKQHYEQIDRRVWVAVVAHELGHVFGLRHEHQRPDRESYIHFDCSKLEGYAEAYAKVKAEGVHDMETVCNDPWLASERYDFHMIFQYTYLDDTVFKNGQMYFLKTQYDEKQLDHLSIMLYSSYNFKKANTPADDALACPLALWEERGKGVQHNDPPKPKEVEIIDFILEVSSGDYDAICKLYPRQG